MGLNGNNNIVNDEDGISYGEPVQPKKHATVTEFESGKTYAFVRKTKIVKKKRSEIQALSEEAKAELEATFKKIEQEQEKEFEKNPTLRPAQKDVLAEQYQEEVVELKKKLFSAPQEEMQDAEKKDPSNENGGKETPYQIIKKYATAVRNKWTREIAKGSSPFRLEWSNVVRSKNGNFITTDFVSDLAPIGKFMAAITEDISNEEVNAMVDVARTKNNSVAEVDTLAPQKKLERTRPELLALRVFPNFDAFFENAEKVYNARREEAIKRGDRGEINTYEEYFNVKASTVQSDYQSAEEKSVKDLAEIKKHAARTYDVVYEDGVPVKYVLKDKYLGNRHTSRELYFNKDIINHRVNKLSGDDHLVALKENVDRVKGSFALENNIIRREYEETLDYDTISGRVQALKNKKYSEYYHEIDAAIARFDTQKAAENAQQNQTSVEKDTEQFFEPTVKLVVEGKIPKGANPDDYEEVVEDEYYEEVSKDEYDRLVFEQKENSKEIENLKDNGIDLGGLSDDDKSVSESDEPEQQVSWLTKGSAEIAKTIETANLYANISKTHSGRFFTMIFHPINYYREGKLLESMRKDLKDMGVSDATLDKLKSGKPVTNDEIVSDYMVKVDAKLNEHKQTEEEKQTLSNQKAYKHGPRATEKGDRVRNRLKTTIREVSEEEEVDDEEIAEGGGQKDFDDDSVEVNEENLDEIVIKKDDKKKEQDVVDYINKARDKYIESQQLQNMRGRRRMIMMKDKAADDLKDVKLSEKEREQLNRTRKGDKHLTEDEKSDKKLWAVLEESLGVSRESIVKRSKKIDAVLVENARKEKERNVLKENIIKQSKELDLSLAENAHKEKGGPSV